MQKNRNKKGKQFLCKQWHVFTFFPTFKSDFFRLTINGFNNCSSSGWPLNQTHYLQTNKFIQPQEKGLLTWPTNEIFI